MNDHAPLPNRRRPLVFCMLRHVCGKHQSVGWAWQRNEITENRFTIAPKHNRCPQGANTCAGGEGEGRQRETDTQETEINT